MTIQLSSFDIHFLMNDFNELIGSKIEKIFQIENEFTLLFVLHIPSKGKQYLFLSLPSTICLVDYKPQFPEVPPNFCASLRRKINNARITNIYQKDFERIIIIELSTKNGTSKLIIELFSIGNIILVDETNKILSIAHSHSWESKLLRVGKEYTFPNPQINPLTLNLKEFKDLIKNSNKESIVKSLAIDLSLGGTYAEQVLETTKIDKNSEINKITDLDLEIIYSSFQKIINRKEENFNKKISEEVLKSLKEESKKDEHKKTNEVVSKLNKIIKAQSNQLTGLDASQQENQEKGELIYKNYVEVEKILNEIKTLKKTMSWKDIKEKLKQNKLFVSLDENNGTLILNLN
ncbi:MAG: NFACT family protein [Candidatus Woesearchaeota archaeon]